MDKPIDQETRYWQMTSEEALATLESGTEGLSALEAEARLKMYGANELKSKGSARPWLLFLSQFKNPIMIILIVATLISGLTGDWTDALIILAIVLASVVLSFIQEYSASKAVEELRSRISQQITVLRDGKPVSIPSSAVVPGDLVLLSAGSLIPADGLLLECNDLYVNQSILTGEALPVEKKPGSLPAGAAEKGEQAALAERTNSVFTGTNVASGSATMLAVLTGQNTEFGKIADQLGQKAPENDFERGIRRFGYMLTQIMLLLTLVVFAINVLARKPAIDSLLFSVALAVGITPQLLPAIINVTLSHGSRSMAKAGVIVRHLTAIENFGSMDILCTDKTGTLTEGLVHLDGAVDSHGVESDSVFRLAYLNASLQTGLVNSLDQAIVAKKALDISGMTKLDEIPYDFSRKRLSIVVSEGAGSSSAGAGGAAAGAAVCTLIAKGALSHILDICDFVEEAGDGGGGAAALAKVLDEGVKADIQRQFEAWSEQGYRVLGIARKLVTAKERFGVQDEQGMTFCGFLLFYDPPKIDAIDTIKDLASLGVGLRMITGDNKQVSLHTAKMLGLEVGGVLTGKEMLALSDEALRAAVANTTIFAEVDPSQKERIILALKKLGFVVGYMGDGINDAPALHVADVSISVNTAVDVAKEAADFVLLEKSLAVLKRGIELGRVAFANTLKYISITTSANFGNMFSMAGASLFMPFLPLLPKQILLINFFTDFPALTLAGDSVDEELIKTPRRWDLRFIRNYMVTFGLISSVFDYLTFAVLLLGFRASEVTFQSGWFIVSILTELMMLLVMRTRKPFYRSRPAPALLFSTLGVAVVTLVLPYLPLASFLSIAPVPPLVLLAMLGIAGLYVLTTEFAKRLFYRRVGDGLGSGSGSGSGFDVGGVGSGN